MSDLLLAGNNTTVVRLTGHQDDLTQLYPTDATVTCDIIDVATGVLLPLASAVSLAYVAGTSGAATMYRGVIPANAGIVAGRSYTRRITAVGAGGTGTREYTKDIVATKS